MTLQHYLRYRRTYEIGALLAFMVVNSGGNAATQFIDLKRAHLVFEAWEPVSWELSSFVVILMLLPLWRMFDRIAPLTWETWRFNLPRHFLASVVFSVVHVGGMGVLRKAIYALIGKHYSFGNWQLGLFYEYLKDVRTYFLIVLAVYCYRFVLLRLQGEALLLSAPDTGPAVESIERPQRFLVRKLGKEFLVAASDIERLEAQGNYVNLHVRGRLYPLRSTMTDIEARLDPAKFVRVHRSHIVNLDHLAEIEPLDTGDARLKLRDGQVLPCSRTYRAALKDPRGIG